MRRRRAVVLVLMGLVGSLLPVTGVAQAADLVSIERVSFRAFFDRDREQPAISADGRFVAFASDSADLVPNDRTLSGDDVFLRDVESGTTERVTVDVQGGDANSGSFRPSVSGDGRYVAFASNASDLVDADGNATRDVFVRDMQTGLTARVSVDSDGGDADGSSDHPSITPDGRYVVFTSSASDLLAGESTSSGVYRRDLQSGVTVLVSLSDDLGPLSISDDGQLVVFSSVTPDLVVGDENDFEDVFVRDLASDTTQRVSVDSSGVEADGDSDAPDISGDGRYVVFESAATNLVVGDGNGWNDVFLRDLGSQITEKVSLSSTDGDANGASHMPSLSADGQFVSFHSHATNLGSGTGTAGFDVFVRDRVAGTTVIASLDSNGNTPDGSSRPSHISADGRFIAFQSAATNLVSEGDSDREDVYRRDLHLGITTLASHDLGLPIGWAQFNVGSYEPSISADARLIAFTAFDDGVMLRDRIAGTTTLVSANADGDNADGFSGSPAISGDGRYVAFVSNASDLVPGFDPQGTDQVFVRDLMTGTTNAVSSTSSGESGDDFSSQPSISADGRYIAFESTASNLVVDDTNGDYDVFVRDQSTGITTRVTLNVNGEQANGGSWGPSISADGRFLGFASHATDLEVAADTNVRSDVFVRDLQTETNVRVSLDPTGSDSDGNSYSPSISGDGGVVAFESDATDLVDEPVGIISIFVHDLASGVTDLVSTGVAGEAHDSYSSRPAISANGRFVAFESRETNLVPGGSEGLHVFLRDLALEETTKLTDLPNSTIGSSVEGSPVLTPDGRFVAFTGRSNTLVVGDTNNVPDVFLAELSVVPPVPVCLGFEATIVGAGTIGGTAGADVIVGSAGADVISGLGGDDVICGLGGDDQLLGGAGADSLSGGEGADTLTGGAAVDLVSFEDSVVGVQVDLVSGVATGQGADTIGSVENVRGSGHDDVILGSGAVNSLEGGGGADQLVGRGGNDLLAGGDGDDLISGMAGDDGINGGIGSDLCVQGSGVGVPVDCESSVMPVSISDASVVETDTGTVPAVFTVSVPLPTDTPISMTVSTVNGTAVAGVDYTARSGFAVSIPANQTSRTVSVVVRGDYTPEPDETFTLDIANLVGGVIADGTGTGIIVDEDPVESLPLVSIDDFEVVETNRASLVVQLRVSLSAPFPVPVTVDFATGPGGTATAGADYTAVAPTRVTFAAGVTERVARVTLLGDTVIESDETLMVVLSNALNAVIGDGEAEILIIDDDTVPVLLLSPVTVVEGDAGNTAAVFTVELDRPYGVQVRVRYATVNGSATGGSDYTSIGNTNLTFAPGQTSRTINVQVVGDLVVEPDETFSLFFSNPLNVTISTTTVQGTITNDD